MHFQIDLNAFKRGRSVYILMSIQLRDIDKIKGQGENVYPEAEGQASRRQWPDPIDPIQRRRAQIGQQTSTNK